MSLGAFDRTAVDASVGKLPRQTPVALLARGSVQIVLGLILAVALPALIRWPDLGARFDEPSLNNAVIGTAAALLLAYCLIRKMVAFPGLQVISFILPIFCICYGIVLVVFFLTRQEYSRFHVLTSFIVAVAFYHYVFLLERRVKRPQLAVLAGGHCDKLQELTQVDWTRWTVSEHLPTGYDGLVADLRAELGPASEAFLARCALAGIPVYHSKLVEESLTGRVAIDHLSENTLGSLSPSSVYARLKLALDAVSAVVLLVPAALICGIAGILIKINSPGPILFTQERMGYRGEVFRIYKLRTMHVASPGELYTESSDPRITRIGAVLRKYRIDELPQLLNIIKGEMSWIGPRPEALPLSQWYGRAIAFYSYRHIVRPGITGWAQVHQGNVATPELVAFKLHFDFYYIKHFSPWLDFVIAAQTVRTVLTGFGSR